MKEAIFHVVVYEKDESFIAQCIGTNIFYSGNSEAEALSKLRKNLKTQLENFDNEPINPSQTPKLHKLHIEPIVLSEICQVCHKQLNNEVTAHYKKFHSEIWGQTHLLQKKAVSEANKRGRSEITRRRISQAQREAWKRRKLSST